MIGYTVWYVRDFVINNRGTTFTTVQTPVNSSVGVKLDASRAELMTGEGQSVMCLAPAGCWYTAIENVNTGVEDTTCPPASMERALEATRTNMIQALMQLSRGVRTAAEIRTGMRQFTDGMNASPFRRVCKHAKQGEYLTNACMYYSPIPTEALSVTFHDIRSNRGDNMGLALVSPSLMKVTSGGLVDKLFGGEEYNVGIDPQLLHYGVAQMNIIDTISENGNMKMGKRSIEKVRSLVPSYPGGVNTINSISDPVINPCHADACVAGLANATAGTRCVTLTLNPGFMIVKNTYQSGNVVTSWLASFGGILSLTMMVMAWLHVLGTKCCGGKFSMCAPFPYDADHGNKVSA